jgi:predicted Ser/Thr protein kinase
MIQEKIDYDKIMALGFNEDIVSDSSYEAEHGYAYCIITKNLTKKIYLDWQKDTKLCKMVRIDSPKTGNIKAETQIMNLEQIKTLINFFSNERITEPNY